MHNEKERERGENTHQTPPVQEGKGRDSTARLEGTAQRMVVWGPWAGGVGMAVVGKAIPPVSSTGRGMVSREVGGLQARKV